MSYEMKMSDASARHECARLMETGYVAWLYEQLKKTAMDSFAAAQTVDELRSARLLLSFADVAVQVIGDTAKSEVKNAKA